MSPTFARNCSKNPVSTLIHRTLSFPILSTVMALAQSTMNRKSRTRLNAMQIILLSSSPAGLCSTGNASDTSLLPPPSSSPPGNAGRHGATSTSSTVGMLSFSNAWRWTPTRYGPIYPIAVPNRVKASRLHLSLRLRLGRLIMQLTLPKRLSNLLSNKVTRMPKGITGILTATSDHRCYLLTAWSWKVHKHSCETRSESHATFLRRGYSDISRFSS